MAASFREAGAGPSVVCLHSNASSSAQWRGLMDLLAPRFHVLAADSYGAGKSPAWPTDRKVTLRDEVELLEPVFARAGEAFSLVGHSYGGALALVSALAHRDRVRALALYEPTLFALVERESPAPNEVDGIRNTVAAAVAALEKGDAMHAARCFIDFWMEPGAFDRMPERNQAAIAEAGRNIQAWKDCLFGEPTPLSAFAGLDVPVLLMVGAKSPLSSRAVARRLARVLPRIEVADMEGLGHMAPVSDPEPVNRRIHDFLARHALA
ncbi:MAG TPA: alpha/beta hydrolase [Burkholderiales bacterium]|nr:alpha/beta hydrolase [Burkholderiales bacterium]